jgi:hypothetical protein
VETTYLSSASARFIGSARPKSKKELKQLSFYVLSSRRCRLVYKHIGKWRVMHTPRVARAVNRKARGNRAEDFGSERNFVHAAQMTSNPNAPLIWPTITGIARARREASSRATLPTH